MNSIDIGCNKSGTLTQTAPDDIVSKFWQQWQENQDKLYRCCLKLMNFNSTDAEDALSQAMLKAWEKVQKYVGKIHNLQAWLVQLTRNLCIDIIRQRSKGATGVDSLEWVGATENLETAHIHDSPQQALEKEEEATAIKQAIASLPESLRNTFILDFYQQRTHTEIADDLGITYDNVCKRISRARRQLKEKLSGYFLSTDGKPEERKEAIADSTSTAHGTEGEEEKPQQVEEAIAPIESGVEEKETKEGYALENTPEKSKVHPTLAQGSATVCWGQKPTLMEEQIALRIPAELPPSADKKTQTKRSFHPFFTLLFTLPLLCGALLRVQMIYLRPVNFYICTLRRLLHLVANK
ncbi:MAG: sigma-70 family RNA polymerase sigma factor [Merismopedia sp. SIO2A8]|nr:sigma-70 family RNA polymerase sigma factor [Symploca sp. SIO2B6]NET49172.1 sigma-70 family RNA polymerase sigma factor [Merismopedia sp. SIO2A8]